MNIRIGRRVRLLLTLCTALFLTSCGQGAAVGETGAGEDAPAGEDFVFSDTSRREWVYVPEVFTVGDEQADYERMQPAGDVFCYVPLEEENGGGTKYIRRYSLTDRKLTEVPIDWSEGGDQWDVGKRFFAPDQSLYMTANVYPEDFGSMKRFLCRFAPDGTCLFSKDITELAGRDVSLCGMTVDHAGRIYVCLDSGEILLFTDAGDYDGSVSYSSPDQRIPARIKGICEGADAGIYVCIGQDSTGPAGEGSEEMGGVRCTLGKIDLENKRLIQVAENLPDMKGVCAGSPLDEDLAGAKDGSDNQYDLLWYDQTAVYGYCLSASKSDAGSAGEELFAWMDSDINGYCVENLYLLEDGRLCATVVDWLNDDRVIVALERTKAEQVPQREELVLATVDGGSNLATMAVKFNRENSQYHLTVKSYESLTDLYNAILTKEPLDLIDLSGINVQKLADRGLFEDLNPYMDRSEALDRSDFVDGILDVYTCDDILVGIPAEFMIQTVVGNGALLENKAGLTLEELYLLADRYPGAKAFDGVTKEEVMKFCLMFNEDAFIDWDAGTCHFDSEEFKALLEYVNRFPDAAVNGREEASLPVKMDKGEVLFAVVETTPYVLWDYLKLFEENTAFVGFPTADGRGGHLLLSSDAYAIAAVSEHKESAWDFIEDTLTREKSDLYAELWMTYPALKKTLDERVEAAITRDRFTWDDVNVALQLVPDATPFFSVDDEILQIINEEAGAYYSGQKGADDAAGVIQNRVQLYVDECGPGGDG